MKKRKRSWNPKPKPGEQHCSNCGKQFATKAHGYKRIKLHGNGTAEVIQETLNINVTPDENDPVHRFLCTTCNAVLHGIHAARQKRVDLMAQFKEKMCEMSIIGIMFGKTLDNSSTSGLVVSPDTPLERLRHMVLNKRRCSNCWMEFEAKTKGFKRFKLFKGGESFCPADVIQQSFKVNITPDEDDPDLLKHFFLCNSCNQLVQSLRIQELKHVALAAQIKELMSEESYIGLKVLCEVPQEPQDNIPSTSQDNLPSTAQDNLPSTAVSSQQPLNEQNPSSSQCKDNSKSPTKQCNSKPKRQCTTGSWRRKKRTGWSPVVHPTYSSKLVSAANDLMKGRYYQAFAKIYKHSVAGKRDLIRLMETVIKMEVRKHLGEKGSVLRTNESSATQEFSWKAVSAETEQQCPMLFAALKGATINRRKFSTKKARVQSRKDDRRIRGVCTAILAHHKNSRCNNRFQKINSIHMWLLGCSRRILDDFARLGWCQCYSTTKEAIKKSKEPKGQSSSEKADKDGTNNVVGDSEGHIEKESPSDMIVDSELEGHIEKGSSGMTVDEVLKGLFENTTSSGTIKTDKELEDLVENGTSSSIRADEALKDLFENSSGINADEHDEEEHDDEEIQEDSCLLDSDGVQSEASSDEGSCDGRSDTEWEKTLAMFEQSYIQPKKPLAASEEPPEGLEEGEPSEGLEEGEPFDGLEEGITSEGLEERNPPERLKNGKAPKRLKKRKTPERLIMGKTPERLKKGKTPGRSKKGKLSEKTKQGKASGGIKKGKGKTSKSGQKKDKIKPRKKKSQKQKSGQGGNVGDDQGNKDVENSSSEQQSGYRKEKSPKKNSEQGSNVGDNEGSNVGDNQGRNVGDYQANNHSENSSIQQSGTGRPKRAKKKNWRFGQESDVRDDQGSNHVVNGGNEQQSGKRQKKSPKKKSGKGSNVRDDQGSSVRDDQGSNVRDDQGSNPPENSITEQQSFYWPRHTYYTACHGWLLSCSEGKDHDIVRTGDTEWIPRTKLGHLVKDLKIKSLEEIYLLALPIKEPEIINFFLGSTLKNSILKVIPVKKKTQDGSQTRYKAFVVTGDYDGYVGLGIKCSKDASSAIGTANLLAIQSIIPVQKGHWGSNTEGKPHTVSHKVTGQSGTVSVRLIPAPPGAGIVYAEGPKKLLNMAGIKDCYISASGNTASIGDFVQATFAALMKTNDYGISDTRKDTPAPLMDHQYAMIS